jgi:acyl-coenzyme A synthetase/AMP-(fatty) acid ligase
MYTSGSTGMPKGVVVPHRAIGRLVLNNGYARLEAGDRVAMAANPAFDAAHFEVWGALLNGGCSVVFDQESVLSPRRFAQQLQAQAVSVLWLTVGLFNQYAEPLAAVWPGLRTLIVGGDALDAGVIRRVLQRGAPQHLLNGYGPTETTTFAITHEIKSVGEHASSIPIGKPISNTRIYILDRGGRLAPQGVAGEIHIGGDGVALGYLNREDLTAERFVPDPFAKTPGARLYRTGDLGRHASDGTIEFLGRKDQQVKLRGFRVELGEIEARLAHCAGVREAVVLARDDGAGGKRLVAYCAVDASAEPAVDAQALRMQLAQHLPDYMVPAAYVLLDALPLTANGKLDRQALPQPEGEAFVTREYEAPIGEVEQTLAQIWAEVLQLERVGRHDNFFELGGHSLLAVSVIERMRATRLDTDVRSLFMEPTLAAFSRTTKTQREVVL